MGLERGQDRLLSCRMKCGMGSEVIGLDLHVIEEGALGGYSVKSDIL